MRTESLRPRRERARGASHAEGSPNSNGSGDDYSNSSIGEPLTSNSSGKATKVLCFVEVLFLYYVSTAVVFLGSRVW